MARPLRIAFPDAIYHVMARCLDNELLYTDHKDYEAFRERLAKAVEIFGLEVYAYCLMPNHYHLFVATPQANISAALQWLNTAYTVWFNQYHERRGHLLQGRFRANLVEDDAYFAVISRYIHLNPVKAGLAARPEEWAWSSYPGYWRRAHEEEWVNYDRTLRLYSGSSRIARSRYRAFVDAGVGGELKDPWRDAWHGFVLGSEAFVEKIRGLIDTMPGSVERDIPLVRSVKRCYDVEEIQHAVARAADMRLEDLTRPRRLQGAYPRKVAVYLCRRLSDARGREIARKFGLRSDSSLVRLSRGVKESDDLVRKTLRALKCENEV